MADDAARHALIARAQAGDVRAFEALVDEHIGHVRRFARAFAHNDADADDLAQEALVKVYRALRSYRFHAAFSTWLYAIVKHAFLDATKSRAGRERAVEELFQPEHADPTADGPPGADALIEQEEDRQLLWAAIARVPVEFRATLVLFDIEGLSHDEIAAREAVPVGTVKSRLSRGRDHLRRALLRADATRSPNAPEREANVNASASRVVAAGNPKANDVVQPPRRTPRTATTPDKSSP